MSFFECFCNTGIIVSVCEFQIPLYLGIGQLLNLLIKKSLLQDNSFLRCVAMNFYDGCEALLEAGASVNAKENMEVTNIPNF